MCQMRQQVVVAIATMIGSMKEDNKWNSVACGILMSSKLYTN